MCAAKKAVRIVCNVDYQHLSNVLLIELQILKLHVLIELRTTMIMYKANTGCLYTRHTGGPVPLRCVYGINRSGTAMIAVVPQWFRVAPRKSVKTADLRGGTAETFNMFRRASAVLPPSHRRRDATVGLYDINRSSTAMIVVVPQ